jgi:hypothetical protein
MGDDINIFRRPRKNESQKKKIPQKEENALTAPPSSIQLFRAVRTGICEHRIC